MSPVSFLRMIYSEVTGPSRREQALTQHRGPRLVGVDPGPPSASARPGAASAPSSHLGRPRLPPPWDEGQRCVHR